MRRFRLVRSRDPSGISGMGAVAEGILFSSGKAVLNWGSAISSLVIYERLQDVLAIHGHDGATTIEWVDS